jgi:hypothetical protein
LGRVVGAAVIVMGVTFLASLTATVTSDLVSGEQDERVTEERAARGAENCADEGAPARGARPPRSRQALARSWRRPGLTAATARREFTAPSSTPGDDGPSRRRFHSIDPEWRMVEMASTHATDRQPAVSGWYYFAGILLGILGALNIVWGIAAIDSANFFTPDAKYIFSDLNTWGWITLFIGVLQIFAAFSLFSGGGYGRVVGVVAGSLSAIAALLSIPASPFWALCIFALAIIVVYELARSRDRV